METKFQAWIHTNSLNYFNDHISVHKTVMCKVTNCFVMSVWRSPERQHLPEPAVAPYVLPTNYFILVSGMLVEDMLVQSTLSLDWIWIKESAK